MTGQKPDGVAANGFIHLINSGATALDGSGACVDAEGNHVMKPFWEMTDADIKACLNATDWCHADYEYFRGGGYSSHFRCKAEMPVTMLRFNIVEGIGPFCKLPRVGRLICPTRSTTPSTSAPTRPGRPRGSARA